MYQVKTTNQLFATILTIIVLFAMFSYYDICLKKPISLNEGIVSDIYVIPRHEYYNPETDSLDIIPLKYYISISKIIDNDTIINDDIEINREQYLKVRFGDKVILGK